MRVDEDIYLGFSGIKHNTQIYEVEESQQSKANIGHEDNQFSLLVSVRTIWPTRPW